MLANPYLRKYYAPRTGLIIALVISGALGGAVIGAVLTVVGKIVAGAPPATAANFWVNMKVFGIFGALVSPVITWSALGRVPLWRTFLEPLLYGAVGAGLSIVFGVPALLLVLTPAGIAAAIFRLSYTHREKPLLALPAEEPPL